MSKSDPDLIKRLADHVQLQRENREKNRSYEPSDAEKGERRRVMDDLVDALGLPPKQIQTMLAVNRTTWERWRNMDSIPNASHLDHLRRLLRDRENAPAERSEAQTLGKPLEFLTARPWTASRLSVLFSHASYRWEDAVFHFTNPFADESTITDMAALALNGCRIVYIVQSRLIDDARLDDRARLDRWPGAFVKGMVAALGATLTARALASFCVVSVAEPQFEAVGEFGVLNFRSGVEDSRVGYIWTGGKTLKGRPGATAPDVYSPVPANDDSFFRLKAQYSEPLLDAFDVIDANLNKGVQEPETDEQQRRFLKLPLLLCETKPEKYLHFYV